MERLRLPKLIIPEGGYRPTGQPRPIQVCGTCHYVLDNGGVCRNLSCFLAGTSSSNAGSDLKYYNNCSLCPKQCTGH